MSPLLKKSNKTSKNYQLKMNCFVAGILAVIIMVFVYLIHSNSLFFGDGTVLRMDLYHQYGPLYAELYDRIVHGYSLVYSWTSGLGGAFLGNLFNYCCSPFALIIFLFGHKNMPEAIAVMILLKAIVSSVTFTYYINKSTKKESIVSAGFGLLYAFCGFFVAYSWNIMWLDAMSVFPLVILGIEKIILDRKPLLFIVALTYTMITNYYMAYMVCILSALYFLYFYFGRFQWKSSLKESAAPDQDKQNEERPAEEKAQASPAADFAAPIAGQAAPPVYESFAPVETQQPENADGYPAQASFGSDFARFAGETPQDILPPDYDSTDTQTAAPRMPAPQEAGISETPPYPPVSAAPVKTKKEKKKKAVPLKERRLFVSGFIFALSGILCFFIAAFALLPVARCLESSSATGSTFTDDLNTYFNFFDFIANHLPGVEPTIRSSGDNVLPNVYCGMLSILLVPFYFLSDKISGKKKVAAVGFLTVFFLSFSVNAFNYLWHGFHFPNDLPYRFSFAYSFLILTLAYEAILHIGDFTRKQYVTAGILTLLFVVIVEKVGSKNVELKTVYMSVVFVIVYVIIAGLLTSPHYVKKSVAGLLVFTIAMELCFANTGNYVMEQSKSNYTGDYDSYHSLRADVEKDEDLLFYRTELSRLRARMDPCWFGYNGVSTFSSMAYENTASLMNKLGFFGNNINSYTYYPQTAIFNSMFSMRYIYDNADMLTESDLYTFVKSEQKTKDDAATYDAYRYNYFLPLTFAVSDRVKQWNPGENNPFSVQNELMADATGVQNVLKDVSATDLLCENLTDTSLDFIKENNYFSVNPVDASLDSTKLTILLEAETAGNYYVYAGGQNITGIHVIANDLDYNYGSSGVDPFILDVGPLEEGDEISVEYSIEQDKSFALLRERWTSETTRPLCLRPFPMTRAGRSAWTGRFCLMPRKKIRRTEPTAEK